MGFSISSFVVVVFFPPSSPQLVSQKLEVFPYLPEEVDSRPRSVGRKPLECPVMKCAGVSTVDPGHPKV